MSTQATVFLVDDDPAVRDSLGLLIEQEGHPVQSFASAEDFLAASLPAGFGCVIVDLRMPGMDGIRLQEEIAARELRLPIIFLSGHGDIPTSVRAIKAGAVDFLTKPVTGDALLRCVATALDESRRLNAATQANHSATSRLATLTEREREVMMLAAVGLPNKEIARRLGISHRTVEIHKARLMHKTGAATLLDLARLADASRAPGAGNSA
jgi:FixJ family two-component response regulator